MPNSVPARLDAPCTHWLVVLMLIVQYVVAWTMPHVGRNTVPETMINLHFSFGMLILVVHSLVSNYALLPLVGLHVAAALYHALVRRDGVLARMCRVVGLRHERAWDQRAKKEGARVDVELPSSGRGTQNACHGLDMPVQRCWR